MVFNLNKIFRNNIYIEHSYDHFLFETKIVKNTEKFFDIAIPILQKRTEEKIICFISLSFLIISVIDWTGLVTWGINPQ